MLQPTGWRTGYVFDCLKKYSAILTSGSPLKLHVRLFHFLRTPFSFSSYAFFIFIVRLFHFLKSPQYLTNIKSLIELLIVILSTLNMICKRIGRTCRIFVLMSLSRQIAKRFLFKIEANNLCNLLDTVVMIYRPSFIYFWLPINLV